MKILMVFSCKSFVLNFIDNCKSPRGEAFMGTESDLERSF
jgi:hypothetical protein